MKALLDSFQLQYELLNAVFTGIIQSKTTWTKVTNQDLFLFFNIFGVACYQVSFHWSCIFFQI